MIDRDLIAPANGLAPKTPLALAGQAANGAASRHVFTDYRERKAPNTVYRQDSELVLFADFLADAGGVTVGDLTTDPQAWQGVTWGLVAGFVRWQLRQGYAVGTVNIRLSTVKVYAKLALKAGTLDPGEFAQIRAVEGYSKTEAKRLDERRILVDIPTRVGCKKACPVTLTPEQATAMKDRPDTPQGRRDALIMCLLLDHGLRVGELAGLTVDNLDMETGELRFYRPKVDKIQTHTFTPDTLPAATAYLETDALALGPLLRTSGKDGRLVHGHAGMTTRAITARVRRLGEQVGIKGLSAHDCRHHWATTAARNGTAIDRLMDAGGWSSPAMPLRYVEAAKIANEGVRLA